VTRHWRMDEVSSTTSRASRTCSFIRSIQMACIQRRQWRINPPVFTYRFTPRDPTPSLSRSCPMGTYINYLLTRFDCFLFHKITMFSQVQNHNTISLKFLSLLKFQDETFLCFTLDNYRHELNHRNVHVINWIKIGKFLSPFY